MNLRLAKEGEPSAITVRDYLRRISDATGAAGDKLIDELDRWAVMEDTGADQSARERRYQAEYDVPEDVMRARLEGFRQATGVLPSQFLELRDEAQGRSSDRVWLPDLLIAPVVEAPAPPPD